MGYFTDDEWRAILAVEGNENQIAMQLTNFSEAVIKSLNVIRKFGSDRHKKILTGLFQGCLDVLSEEENDGCEEKT